jgi:glycine cleavage system regulatory protein
MTILGKDQRGLVSMIAALVEQHGGSWVESRLARLAGHLAGVIRVECPTAGREALHAALGHLEGQGIHITLIQEPICEMEGLPRVACEVLGNDRPGIVRELTEAIAGCGGNVEELVTDVESAPMSGDLLFRARGVVSFQDEASISLLQSAIEQLSDDLSVSIIDC